MESIKRHTVAYVQALPLVSHRLVWGEKVTLSGFVRPPLKVPYAGDAASGVFIAFKVVGVVVAAIALGLWAILNARWGGYLIVAFQLALVGLAAWRIVLIIASREPHPQPPQPTEWPLYTILAALYDEAEILPQLVSRLSLIDYPHDALEGFILLEADDFRTQAVARNLRLPAWLKVVVVPQGNPKTKPRALNYGLEMATGQFLTIYDAEDSPDPAQLKEAVSRFMHDAGDCACLQAPLRVQRRFKAAVKTDLLDRQFAAEYAGLFEVILPGMARMGLPFPLGGTSNHFRVDVLRAVGGWDAFNVTEDADLGFRLWRAGWKLGTITSPTWETPPGPFTLWLPQRTRWIKGYLQTLAVHLGKPGLGPRGVFAFITTLIAGLVAASIHGYALAAVTTLGLLSLMSLSPPEIGYGALSVLITGYCASWMTCWVGCNRIGIPYGIKEIAMAPLYWALLTIAFFHALVRLVFQPHTWDKTPHLPDIPVADHHTPVIRPTYSAAPAGRKAA